MFTQIRKMINEGVQPVVSTLSDQLSETFKNVFTPERRRELPAYNIILVAPFDAEKAEMGRVLVEELGDRVLVEELGDNGCAFDDTQAVVPLAPDVENAAVIYNLPGFYGERSVWTRRLLGLAPISDQTPSDTDSPTVNIGASVCLVVIDTTMVPLLQAPMEKDFCQLKQVFGKRVVFAGINKTKLESWNRESREGRIELWKGLLGDSLIYCALETGEGKEAVIAEMSASIG